MAVVWTNGSAEIIILFKDISHLPLISQTRDPFQMYDIGSANVLVAPCEEEHLKVDLILLII